MAATFVLADAYARAKERPDRFELPEEEKVRALQPGSQVKLIFLISYKDSDEEWVTEGERMWVEIAENKYPNFSGILDNDPCCTNDIKSGIKISFTVANVIEVYDEETT